MILGVTLSVIYVAIAALAMVMTRIEQQRRQKGFLLSLAGLVLCAVWPLTMLGMLVWIHWRKTPQHPQGPDAVGHVAAFKIS